MRIAVVAPSPVPFTRGGAERALWGMAEAINDLTVHEAEMIKIPVPEHDLPSVMASYRLFSELDLTHFDRVVATKYPAWMVDHPHKTVFMFHVLRGVYDTYWTHGLADRPQPLTHEVAALSAMIAEDDRREAVPEVLWRFDQALAAHGPDHPDLAFPGPFARQLIHWLDGVAMAPGAVRRYLSLSQTVADREGYFPPGIHPRVVHLPGALPATPRDPAAGHYLFTVSRLDRPKRLDLLIDAMAHVPSDVELRIAGTGPQAEDLRRLASGDARISFLGFTRDDQLPQLYADAVAVPFVPADEDLGLITLEAFSQATPVVTCTDSGGPTELVDDGETGLVTAANPVALGRALARLADDPALARRLGEAGRRRGEQLRWDDVVAAVLDEPPPRQRPPAAAAELLAAVAPSAGPAGGPRSTAGPRRGRVVVLSTFGIDHPRHGGQLRCRHLYGSLTDTTDVEVLALADGTATAARRRLAPGLVEELVPRTEVHTRTAWDLSVSIGTEVSDLVAGTHIGLTPNYLDALSTAMAGADAVILAEPYLQPALEALDIERPVICDAYNVEAELKATAYPDTVVGRRLLAQVVDVERRAVQRAQAVTTCSLADATTLAARYGRDLEAFTVIPNGTVVTEGVPTPGERRANSARWRRRFWQAGDGRAAPGHLAVFFGSWHPPNIEAARLLVDVAPLLPGVEILSVGHHGAAFGHGQAFRNFEVPANLTFTGTVSDITRRQLLASADVALNPMRSGSGTNLKLVEYLAAAVPVVSTPFGARGVDVVDGRHLILADADPVAFAGAVAATLTDPDRGAHLAAAGRALAVERYGWDALGRRLAEVVTDLVAMPARQ
ncbi:MAG: glycosyltransferase family 4 protein [Acidimicrobiales bacterium]